MSYDGDCNEAYEIPHFVYKLSAAGGWLSDGCIEAILVLSMNEKKRLIQTFHFSFVQKDIYTRDVFYRF